jgi:hypothetical protein
VNEAEERKARSNERIEAVGGLRLAPMLPVIETAAASLRRSDSEVAHRALALAAVAVTGEGHAMGADGMRAYTDDLVARLQLPGHVTPDEQAFIDADDPPQRDVVQFTWRYECAWLMHWALGFVDELAWPEDLCDAASVMIIVRDHGHDGYLDAARLRPQEELLDAADLIYRIHWAVVDARLGGGPADGVDPGVVVERHHALNWLIGYGGQAWDDISTDT